MIDDAERASLVRRLADLGIAEDDIAVDPQSLPVIYPGAAMTIKIGVPAADAAELGEQARAVIAEVVGQDVEPEVRFSSSECESLLADARGDAFADAQERVGELASAADLELGGIAGISDGIPASDLYAGVLAITDPCARRDDAGLAGFDVFVDRVDAEALDADPVVRVLASVTVTRSVE